MKSEIIVKEMKLRTIRGIFGFLIIVFCAAAANNSSSSGIPGDLTVALVGIGLLTVQYFSHKKIVMENLK